MTVWTQRERDELEDCAKKIANAVAFGFIVDQNTVVRYCELFAQMEQWLSEAA